MKKSSSATWHGSGKEGYGKLSSQSQALQNVPYKFATRFGDEKGTNPEELIAAAHAGCFTMKLSFVLTEAGHTPEVIKTNCSITLEDGKISGSLLDVHAKVPGLRASDFEKHAEEAKKNCPVSLALNIPIELKASLIDETSDINHEIQKTEV